MNGYFQVSGQASVPVTLSDDHTQPNGPVWIDGTQPWTSGPLTFQFGYQFDAQTEAYITDILFQTKYINKNAGSNPDPNTVYGTRSSMLYIEGVHVVPDHCPHISLRCPIHVPKGFKFHGVFFNHNNNNESQNMIATLTGYMFDNPADEAKFWLSR